MKIYKNTLKIAAILSLITSTSVLADNNKPAMEQDTPQLKSPTLTVKPAPKVTNRRPGAVFEPPPSVL